MARRATRQDDPPAAETPVPHYPEHAPVVEMFEPDPAEHYPPPPEHYPPPDPEPAPPAAPVVREPAELVRDLGPATHAGPVPRRDGEDYGLGREWGSTWRWTAQGWVDQDLGIPRWRPVVTTTTDFPEWQVDTYLGVVAGEAAVVVVEEPSLLGRALDEGRAVAMRGLTDAAVARGAHAVVGANLSYTTIDDRVVVSAIGTAVTLRDRG